jgi:replicative DNA helicase
MDDGYGYGGADQDHTISAAPVPANTEAEQALLGALLVNNSAILRIADFLKPEHFYEPVHQRIYAAIVKLIETDHIASPVTLKIEFDRDGSLAEIGGAKYLARLAGAVVTIVNAVDYARTVVECWKGRRLLEIAELIQERAPRAVYDKGAAALCSDIEGMLYALGGAAGATQDGGLMALGVLLDPAIQAAEAAWRNEGHTQGVTTGIRKLDEMLGGMMPKEVVLLAGRPSMGKSTAAKTAAYRAAQAGKVVAIFSLEMGNILYAQWFLAETGISASRMRRGEIDANDIAELMRAADEQRPLPVFIDDRPRRTPGQIIAAVRRLKKQLGRVDLVIVDHIGLCGAPAEIERQGQTAIVTYCSRALHEAAKDLEVAMLILSQLSREVEKREDKRPMLADLRDSGSLEQDAEVVVFVYRAEYYLTRSEPEHRAGEDQEKYAARRRLWQDALDRSMGIVEYIVGKQRSGPTGTVPARFEPVYSRNSDLEGSLL